MVDLSDISIEVVKSGDKEGVFKVGPLPKGFGHTFVNPIRRVLLSSMPGGAITSMRLSGIEHEYSTMKGVKETVVEIQMNLKAVRFACESDEPQTLVLKKKGKGEVYAKDFDVTESVQIVSPDVKIATITDSGTNFDLEVVVERGVGFQIADEDLRSEVGRLPMNADFSPVERVVPKLEKARKGEQTDLDMIELSIFTDGSIDPKTALGSSCEILKSGFEKIVGIVGTLDDVVISEAVEETREEKENEALDWLIDDLPVSTRVKSRIIEAEIKTVRDLVGKSPEELLGLPGFGDAALKELRETMSEYGLTLSE